MEMEINECNFNHLDADVLLPPRKRLLSGFKKQIPFTNLQNSSEFDTRMNDLLKNPNLSNEEIVLVSRQAAIEASEVASVARIVAEEKASKAAMALANAKRALQLMTNFNEETNEHVVVVDSLYSKKKKSIQSRRTDEELARKLHQVINSSSRISKNVSNDSKSKSSKHKKLKHSLEIDHTLIRNRVEKYYDLVKFKNRDTQTYDDDGFLIGHHFE